MLLPQQQRRSCAHRPHCRGFNLPARAVIHTVGPVYYEDEAAECRAELTSAYRECLQIASKEVRPVHEEAVGGCA
jgi:O-acetyl-ADP-ribose deacetylase (regulator of RNase III)